MADDAEPAGPREKGSRGDVPGCPICGTAIPEPVGDPARSDHTGPVVTRCPGCGEEYPEHFLMDDFIQDAAARFRLEGKGELGAFGEGGIPKAVDRLLAGGAVFETGSIPDRKVGKGELVTGDSVGFQVAPTSEIANSGRGLPGDEVLHSRKPGPRDDSLMSARTPEPPAAPEGPPGVTAQGVGRDEEATPASDRKTRPAPPQ